MQVDIPESARPQTKVCPFCAERIRLTATVCRHCGRVTWHKRWYMRPWIRILTFVVFTPLWVAIVLDDPESTPGVRVLATLLLVGYALGGVGSCYLAGALAGL